MPLTTLLLIYAVFFQVLLVFLIMLKLRKVRFAAVREGQAQIEDIRANHNAWPEHVRKVQNALTNQFELPILFYVVVLFGLFYGLNDWVFVGLSWLFVASRYVHAYFHTGTNAIMPRFRSFFIGFLTLGALWVYFMVTVTLQYI